MENFNKKHVIRFAQQQQTVNLTMMKAIVQIAETMPMPDRASQEEFNETLQDILNQIKINNELVTAMITAVDMGVVA